MGRLDVDAMLAEMTAPQFAEWEAFFALEPWGAEIEDHRAGVLASTVANLAGRKLRDGQRLKPVDFFPSRSQRRDTDVLGQVHAIFGSMVRKE